MKINVYRNYVWIDKDPIVDALRTICQDEKLTNYEAAAITGVSVTTFANWFEGPTQRPMNATSTQVAAALGYVRRDELKSDGTVTVGYVKARKVDYKSEREKQADWLLKNRQPARQRRKKRDGK